MCTAPGPSELSFGGTGSGTKVMGVVYVPREVQRPGHGFTAAVDAEWAETYSGNHSRFIYRSQHPHLCREVTG